MANDTDALQRAKVAKEDEYYTQLPDIENELRHYRRHFKDKVVLCNCDDPFESNFFKYFVLNFNKLKLKKLIATCYVESPIMGGQLSLFDVIGDEATEGTPYKAVVTVVRDATGDGAIQMDDVAELFKTGENELTELEGDGDFRSEECLALLDEADIVVTNPPFSLFREYIATLMERQKKFLVIGPQNALHYKEIFPFLKNGDLWVGYGFGDMSFKVPEHYEPRETRYWQDESGQKWRSLGNVCWLTNLDIKKRHEEFIAVKKYDPASYPTYSNFDGINVAEVISIPVDYKGAMGVPDTFVRQFNPEQFEIIGMGSGALAAAAGVTRNYRGRTDLAFVDETGTNKCPYSRILIRYTDQWIADHPEDFKQG